MQSPLLMENKNGGNWRKLTLHVEVLKCLSLEEVNTLVACDYPQVAWWEQKTETFSCMEDLFPSKVINLLWDQDTMLNYTQHLSNGKLKKASKRAEIAGCYLLYFFPHQNFRCLQ